MTAAAIPIRSDASLAFVNYQMAESELSVCVLVAPVVLRTKRPEPETASSIDLQQQQQR